MRKTYKLGLILVLFLTCFYSNALATGSSGFELATNSAKSLGRANAVTADPNEPAAIAFNPAGLTSLPGHQVSMSTSVITLDSDFNHSDGSEGDGGAILMSTVPAMFLSLSTPIKQLKVGAGVNAPFGLTTQYSSTGNFRYTANYSQVKTVGYNLSAAYEVANWLSVGGGVTYLDAYLKQAGKLNNTYFAGGFPLDDSNFELDTHGDGWGINVGAQIKPAKKHFIGLFYRTKVRTDLSGEASVDNIPYAVLGPYYNTSGSSFNTGASTKLTFPGSLTLGYKYQINDKWDLGADVTWTRWSVFDQLDVTFDQTSTILQGLTPVKEEYRNTFSVNLGTTYQLNEVWSISGGYFYYQRAANPEFYSNALPDSDRNAVCVGLGYSKNNYAVNLSYIAEFVSKISIDNNVGATNGSTIDGEYSSFVNIVSIDALYKF